VTGARDNSFGRLLLEHRKAAKLTQADLARNSGVSIRALRELEHGRAHAAQQRSAERLADALGLTGDERAVFLTVAKEGRRRVPSSTEARALCALPPALPDFVGRTGELSALRAEVAASGALVAIVGHPGVGKTALAVWAAHQFETDFPDGCFAVDLRGMDDQAVPARAVLDRLLRALDVAPPHIPTSETEQANLFRALLAERKVLLLLDNAADEQQVRPLLATAPGCLTIVTARRALAGLEAARWLWLEPLADPDAIDLLGLIVGPERVAADLAAAAELVALCGKLPLAVRIAGNRLASRPFWSLAYLVEQLRDERTRLGSLSAGDLQVRSAFELSYRRLSAPARPLFRRLAAIPGADFGPELAELLAEAPEPKVSALLDELVDAGLVQPAPTLGRFQLHDLIRLFAAECWRAEEPAPDRDRLHDALLDHLLDRATTAGRALFPDSPEASRLPVKAASEWLEREESNWRAAQRAAARLGWHREVVELTKAMHWYSDTKCGELPWDDIFGLGVAAARVLGAKADLALLLNFLGWAQQVCSRDFAGALASHEEALAVAVRSGTTHEQAWAHGYIGTVLMCLGDLDPALEHSRKACELSGEFGFWPMQVPLRARLCRTLLTMGRHEEAFGVVALGLADMQRHRAEGNPDMRRWVRAMFLLDFGHCLSGLGRWRRAAQAYHDARTSFATDGHNPTAAEAALHEGKAWRVAGEFDRARECLELALTGFTGPADEPHRESARSELELLPVR